jgi:predicted GNAT family N-acyltransferase
MDQTLWQEIAWGGSEYALTVALRHTLLRAPLGLHFAKEALDAEKDSVHLAGFDPSGTVRACLVLRPSVTPSWIQAGPPTRTATRTETTTETTTATRTPQGPREAILDTPAFHMRQVAVRQDLQGQGLGRELMDYAHAWVLDMSPVRQVYLHARSQVVGFYEATGYKIYGEAFWEVGLEHRAMHRFLES